MQRDSFAGSLGASRLLGSISNAPVIAHGHAPARGSEVSGVGSCVPQSPLHEPVPDGIPLAHTDSTEDPLLLVSLAPADFGGPGEQSQPVVSRRHRPG